MSRLDGRWAEVEQDAQGCPASVQARGDAEALSVDVIEHWREWLGAATGAPERDVWRVATPRGVIELHHVYRKSPNAPRTAGEWVLLRWED